MSLSKEGGEKTMLNKLKTLAISSIAFVGVLAAMGGIQPTSIGYLYQPELPQSFK
jgi:cyclic lactone autoinducer peptide